jgi:hypothetical protein
MIMMIIVIVPWTQILKVVTRIQVIHPNLYIKSYEIIIFHYFLSFLIIFFVKFSYFLVIVIYV